MKKKPEIRVHIRGMRPSKPIKVPSYAPPDIVAAHLVDEITTRTPIDTGNAQDGWRIQKRKNGNFVVRNDVVYVEALERGQQFGGRKRRRRGHSNQAPQGFQRQALASTRDFIREGRQFELGEEAQVE